MVTFPTKTSWQCVHFVSPEHYRRFDLSEVKGDVLLIEGDVSNVVSNEELLGRVADLMQFPEYFGGNWDALEECLRDLEWLSAKGYVLSLHGAHELWTRQPNLAGMLVESWLFCAEEWAKSGVAFHLVFVW